MNTSRTPAPAHFLPPSQARASSRPALTSAGPAGRLLAVAGALALSACGGVEWGNLQPARDLARQQQQARGDVHTGWRIFQERCAGCHGADAGGAGKAPDLRVRVRTLGPRSFASLVLARYDWGLPNAPARSDTSAGREAWVDAVAQRQTGSFTMPAWQGEPAVSAHVMDLYAYLGGRADGSVGPGEPPKLVAR